MKNQVIYLSDSENEALTLLAEGCGTRHVKTTCTIPPCGFDIFTTDLRRKTGIRDHKNYMECRTYLEKYAAAIAGNGPTEQQTRALRGFTESETMAGLGYRLRIAPDAMENLLDEACRAAGIFTRDDRARRYQARLYLALFRFNAMPLSPHETEILRHMAADKSFAEISEIMPSAPVSYLKGKAKAACIRLGFDAKGRNTQRNLLRAYFAYLDAQTAVQNGMDDPMF